MAEKSGSDDFSMRSINSDDKQLSANDSPEVEDYDWYHGYLPREETKKLLKNVGDFIMRQTELNKGAGFQLVISVRAPEKVAHFPLFMTQDRKLYMSRRKTYATVKEMVYDYMHKKEEINDRTRAVLKHSVPRQSWELQREKIQLGKIIGHGEFGDVYKGKLELENYSQEVAIKLLKKVKLNKDVISDFSREARLLRDFKHPNIIRFLGVSFEKEPIMICMELAESSLDNYLKKRQVLIPAKLRMCIDAAQGLAYLHSKKWIHRDVSARNCLISQKRAKISDFGLAYQPIYKTNQLKLNAEKLPVRWLAPEAMDGQYSEMSDVYSFGVLMWEIFTNAQTPFKDLPLSEVCDQVQNNGLRLSRPDEMPEDVGQIMTQGCFGNFNSRWTMEKIRNELGTLYLKMYGSKKSSVSKKRIITSNRRSVERKISSRK